MGLYEKFIKAIAAAYHKGYDAGWEAAETTLDEDEDGYTTGHEKGYNVGLSDGQIEGYEEGKAEGIITGKFEGYQLGYEHAARLFQKIIKEG